VSCCAIDAWASSQCDLLAALYAHDSQRCTQADQLKSFMQDMAADCVPYEAACLTSLVDRRGNAVFSSFAIDGQHGAVLNALCTTAQDADLWVAASVIAASRRNSNLEIDVLSAFRRRCARIVVDFSRDPSQLQHAAVLGPLLVGCKLSSP